MANLLKKILLPHLGSCHLLLAVLNAHQASLGHKSWFLAVDTSHASIYWTTEFSTHWEHLSPSLAGFRRYHLSSLALQSNLQSQVVTLGTLRVSPHSVTSDCMEDQHRIQVSVPRRSAWDASFSARQS